MERLIYEEDVVKALENAGYPVVKVSKEGGITKIVVSSSKGYLYSSWKEYHPSVVGFAIEYFNSLTKEKE
jgi:hypothetical protein